MTHSFWCIAIVCGECKLPAGILSASDRLGWNAFGESGHGEKTREDAERVRERLLMELKKEGREHDWKFVNFDTQVMEVTFKF